MVDKTAAETQAEERLAAIARGDIIEGDEADEIVEASTEGEDEPEEEGGGADADVEESEEETEDSAGESGDDEEEAEEDSVGITIPKARFDEALKKARERQRELEERLAKAEQQHAKETTSEDIQAMQTSIEKLQDEYEDNLMEGELEKARAIRRELNKKQNSLTEARLVQQSQQTGNAAVEQIRYEAKLANLESRFPAINPDSPDYDEATMTEVAELMSAFKAGGLHATAALEKAVHYALRDDDAVTEDPAIKRSQRAHKQRKKNADAAKKMPPDIAAAGRDSDKGGKGDGLPDVTKMSPEQFDKLSEAELSKMRGDVLGSDA
jgi:chromosome segregation ATPase